MRTLKTPLFAGTKRLSSIPPRGRGLQGFSQMGNSLASRRAALLYELCVEYGYCNGLDEAALANCATAEDVVRAVVHAEGLDPDMLNREERATLTKVADDWLFSRRGRGAQSGLPR